jgi:excisionase family DNA binding protein
MQPAIFRSTHEVQEQPPLHLTTKVSPRTQQITSTDDCEMEIPPSAERFLTIKDVCKQLGVSRTTVWRLMHEHGLRVIHVGGLRRIREHDLVIWLERHSTSSNGGSQTNERKGSGSP